MDVAPAIDYSSYFHNVTNDNIEDGIVFHMNLVIGKFMFRV